VVLDHCICDGMGFVKLWFGHSACISDGVVLDIHIVHQSGIRLSAFEVDYQRFEFVPHCRAGKDPGKHLH
jgi:hypothetical protein